MMKLSYLVLAVSLVFSAIPADANHAWSKYHWNLSTADTQENPLILTDNLSSVWRSSLTEASSDWNESVLKNTVKAGTNSACNPVLGRVEVCNSEYGENGWLGIAQVWVYRGKDGHIAQALVKMNDTYFNLPAYDSQAWRDFVVCQEVGHTFGLDHQDENFSNTNLGTCMDYTNDPDGSTQGQLSNVQPNGHDYQMLQQIYAHLNETSDGGSGKGNGKGKPAGVGNSNIDLNNASAWGSAVSRDAQGKVSLYERNLGNASLFTHVIWAQ